MASVIRAFIAIDLTSDIIARLEGVIQELQKRIDPSAVRWVPVHNIHLTLKFLGNVSVTNLEVLQKLLSAESRSHEPFEISVGDLGAFPSARRPRVIWTGIQAPPDLETLQRAIESETARLGYAPEERPFTPHLTLGRVSRNADSADARRISEVLDKLQVGFLGAMRVDTVHLYRSDLKPGGAVYTRLFTTHLGLPEKQA